MLVNNRVFLKKVAGLTDLSKYVNDVNAGSIVVPINTGTDFIAIGGDLPFNHRYFQFTPTLVNAVAAQASVDLWDGTVWTPAVDVIDTTSVGGKSFARNGLIQWTPKRDKIWLKQPTTLDIPDLAAVEIYNFWWARIKFDASLTGTLSINYVGHKFSNDADLAGFHAELLNPKALSAFKAGKTNWDEQHIEAGEIITRDMRKRNIIYSKNQILDPERFTEASKHKVAEIAYFALGQDFEDKRIQAEKYYRLALDQQQFVVDKDRDGRIDYYERFPTTGIFRR